MLIYGAGVAGLQAIATAASRRSHRSKRYPSGDKGTG
ncbi:MAG: hypothetical protein IPH85_12380 [Ignavibacteria bacterium]|nr:hypothetical protein [Ignavibacteria bacterium]